MYSNPRQVYKETHATTSVAGASPHKLITLLFDACQESLATAKGAMERGETRNKAISIKKAIEIVVRLQAALDFDKGGVIATRLDDLYTFCTNQLAMANALNDAAMIDDVYKVIAELKLGWSQIEGVAAE